MVRKLTWWEDFKCYFGMHLWGEEWTERLEPETVHGRYITMLVGGRTFHLRECSRCGMIANFYPQTKRPTDDPI